MPYQVIRLLVVLAIKWTIGEQKRANDRAKHDGTAGRLYHRDAADEESQVSVPRETCGYCRTLSTPCFDHREPA